MEYRRNVNILPKFNSRVFFSERKKNKQTRNTKILNNSGVPDRGFRKKNWLIK